MQAKADFRPIERAADELSRGEAVTLEGITIRAAEAADSAELPAQSRLVLSMARARHLDLLNQGTPVVLTDITPALLTAALHAPALPLGHPAPRPADAVERAALWLVRRAGFLPAALLGGHAAPNALSVTLAQAQAAIDAPPRALTRLPQARLPIAGAEDTRVIPFREAAGATHLALLIGHPEKMAAPLTRLHSSCLTGDLLGSLRCDCGDQLHLALAAIAKNGGGILLYLDQEGRGIGLANKLRAYHLQDLGYDTLDANNALGFCGDERDFSLAARILQALGVPAIRLLTNNPAKVASLEAAGVRITERVPLKAMETVYNEHYLATKRQRMGHKD